MRNSSENRILETLPLFVLDRRDLFTIGTLEGRKLREPSKLGDNSDKLHPVTAGRARQKFLPRMFGWHGQKMSPSMAIRIENLNRGRHRSSMYSVPRDRLGRAAPFCPVASHVDLLGDRQSVVDLDAATENLVTAARALGISEEVTNDANLSGEVRIGLTPARAASSPLFEAIPRRQSTRADYKGKVPATTELALLEAAGAGNGVNALLLTDRKQVESIIEYVISANTAQMANRDFLAELKRWIRFNESEALGTRDGLFFRCFGNPSLPHWLGGFLFDVAFSAASENDKYARQMRSSAGVAVFVSEISDKMHWVQAGRRCQHFALQATALGMRIAFVNQPVEVSAVRSQLAAHLGISDRRPDLIVRFGYGAEMPRSLRRPVEEVIA
jgi:hypothetical protein